MLGGIAGTKSAHGAPDGLEPTGGDAFDAAAPPSGPFSALVGVVVNGQLVCTGALVEARLVVTAASCLPPSSADSGASAKSSVCLAISGACVPAPAPQLDPSGEVAAFVLASDALAEPITYGRGPDAPVAGDMVSVQGYADPASSVATIIATDATSYTAILGGEGGAVGAYLPTDLGAPMTFTAPSSADGTITTAAYGILVSLPAASDAGTSDAVYARLDTLAGPFLDPLVQNTRTDPYEGCR